MPRPRIRGHQWSLNQVRVDAGLSRGMVRSLVATGWLAAAGPYAETDIVLARTGEAWSRMFPDAREVATHPLADTARRLAYAAAVDPTTRHTSVLLATGTSVQAADTLPVAVASVSTLLTDPMVILPLGVWVHSLPSRRSLTTPPPTSAYINAPSLDFPQHTPPALLDDASSMPPAPTPTPHPAAHPPTTPSSPAPDGPVATPPSTSHMPTNPPAPDPEADHAPSAFAQYSQARDALLAAAEARRPQPYSSPAEPW